MIGAHVWLQHAFREWGFIIPKRIRVFIMRPRFASGVPAFRRVRSAN
jgi:hypothetical protein